MERVECPICGQLFAKSLIAAHADRCLDKTDVDDAQFISDGSFSTDSKRARLESLDDNVESASPCARHCTSPALFGLDFQFAETESTSASVVPLTDVASLCQKSAQNAQPIDVCSAPNVQPCAVNETASFRRSTNSAGLWGIFSGPQKSVQLKGSKLNKGSVKHSVVPSSTLQSDVQLVNVAKENCQTKPAVDMSNTVKESSSAVAPISCSSTAKLASQTSTVSSSVPLAERMRPAVLADFVGQGHVVGSQRPLRSLLESATVSSMVLWGPPGCGKVAAQFSLMQLR